MKLHLRDLFWLVLVCALGMGWWWERREDRRKTSNLWKIVLAMGKCAHDKYGMEGGFSEDAGYLYINGKRIWSTDDSQWPAEEPTNWPGRIR
jgi:hypothetical protein